MPDEMGSERVQVLRAQMKSGPNPADGAVPRWAGSRLVGSRDRGTDEPLAEFDGSQTHFRELVTEHAVVPHQRCRGRATGCSNHQDR